VVSRRIQDHIVSAEEIQCTGCSKNKPCVHEITVVKIFRTRIIAENVNYSHAKNWKLSLSAQLNLRLFAGKIVHPKSIISLRKLSSIKKKFLAQFTARSVRIFFYSD
jgi:hypothetical protein